MITTESSAGVTVPAIYVDWGVRSYGIDHLTEEEKKSKGRKKKFVNLKSEQRTKQQKIEHIKKLTKFPLPPWLLATAIHWIKWCLIWLL
jgi:hypothetical protein